MHHWFLHLVAYQNPLGSLKKDQGLLLKSIKKKRQSFEGRYELAFYTSEYPSWQHAYKMCSNIMFMKEKKKKKNAMGIEVQLEEK